MKPFAKRASASARRASGGVVVYVCTSYPSFSETFVATEMEARLLQGQSVMVYSLRRPPSALTARVPYLARPLGWGLGVWAVPGVALLIAEVARGMRFDASSLLKVLYASAHAARIRFHLIGFMRPIILHAHFLDRPADVASLVRMRGLRRFVTVHASDATAERDRELKAWRVSRADRIVCASEFVKKALTADCPQVEAVVIHCGVSPSLLERSVRETSLTGRGILSICTVARLIPSKGHEYAAVVVERLVASGHRVLWHIVGDGPQRGAVEVSASALRALGVEVSLDGALPHEQALELIADADIFLLPSRKGSASAGDGIPVALMEAMALRTLVVTTPAGGIPELVSNGVTGIVGEYDDPASCADRIHALVSDVEAWAAVLDRAQIFVGEQFNVAHSARLLNDMTGGGVTDGC